MSRLKPIRIGPVFSRHDNDTIVDHVVLDALRECCDLQTFLPDLELYSRSEYDFSAHLQNFLLADFSEKAYPEPSDFHIAEWSLIDRFSEFSRTVEPLAADSQAQSFDKIAFEHSSSAGLPADVQGKLPHKGDPGVLSQHKRLAAGLLHNYDEADDKIAFLRQQGPIDLAFHRTQLSKRSLPKVRHVFGRSFYIILLEGLFAQPLISHFLENPDCFAVGLNLFEQTRLLGTYVQDSCVWTTGDWSKFDRFTLSWELHRAFNVLESLLQLRTASHLTRMAWSLVRNAFIYSRVIGPDGILYEATGLVPSGSYFTWMIDSIVNGLRLTYFFEKTFQRIPRFSLLGDDFVILAHRAISELELSRFFEFLPRGFKPGSVINGHDPTELEFLGHQIRCGILYRSQHTVFLLVIYPERPRQLQGSIDSLLAAYIDSGTRYIELYQAYRLLSMRHKIRVCNVGTFASNFFGRY